MLSDCVTDLLLALWLQDYLATKGVFRLSLHSTKIAVPLGSHADKTSGKLDRVEGR